MAKGLDSLKASITDWMSDKAQTRAGSTSGRVASGKISEVQGAGGLKEQKAVARQMGLDPEVAKNIDKYTKDIVKLNSSLTRSMLDQGIMYKEAIQLLKKQKSELRGTSKLREEDYRREIRVLNLLEKQYKIQRKKELIEKTLKGAEPIIGKSSAKFAKHAITGSGGGAFDKQVAALSKKMPKYAKMFQLAGRVMTGTLALVIGVIHGGASPAAK
ncbi:unnamed protein product, partial [marine sediment metagenome]